MDFNHDLTLKQNKKSTPSIFPRRLGIISDPPVLVLIYQTQSTPRVHHAYSRKSGLTRKRKMPLRKFTDKTDVEKYLFTFTQRHNDYLSGIPKIVLEKMLRVIQEIQKGLSTDDAVALVDKEYTVNPETDLNKVSVHELEKRKEIMSESFMKNSLQPGDPGFIYDKQIEFDVHQGLFMNDWDDNGSSEIHNQDKTDEKTGHQLDETLESDVTEASQRKVDLELDMKLTDDAEATKPESKESNPSHHDYFEFELNTVKKLETNQISSSFNQADKVELQSGLGDGNKTEQEKLESRIWSILAPEPGETGNGDMKKLKTSDIDNESSVYEFDDISKELPQSYNYKPKKHVTFRSENLENHREESDTKYLITDGDNGDDDLIKSMSEELCEVGDDDSEVSLESMDLANAFGTEKGALSEPEQSKIGFGAEETLSEPEQSKNVKMTTKLPIIQQTSDASRKSNENVNTRESETDTEDNVSQFLKKPIIQSNQIPSDFMDAGWSITSEKVNKNSTTAEVEEFSEIVEELENDIDSILEDSESQSSLTNKRMPKDPELSLSKEYDFKLDLEDDDEEFWK